MDKFRPPLATELLLSNDGDQILEGSVSNFFVVCRKVDLIMYFCLNLVIWELIFFFLLHFSELHIQLLFLANPLFF